MTEISGACQSCHATVSLPLPDVWQTPEGEIIPVEDLDAADAFRDYLHGIPCPRCGGDQIRITLPRHGAHAPHPKDPDDRP